MTHNRWSHKNLKVKGSLLLKDLVASAFLPGCKEACGDKGNSKAEVALDLLGKTVLLLSVLFYYSSENNMICNSSYAFPNKVQVASVTSVYIRPRTRRHWNRGTTVFDSLACESQTAEHGDKLTAWDTWCCYGYSPHPQDCLQCKWLPNTVL